MSEGFLFDLTPTPYSKANVQTDSNIYNLDNVLEANKTERVFAFRPYRSNTKVNIQKNTSCNLHFHIFRTPNCSFVCSFCSSSIKNGDIAAGCRVRNKDACLWCIKNNPTVRSLLIPNGKTSYYEKIIEENEDLFVHNYDSSMAFSYIGPFE